MEYTVLIHPAEEGGYWAEVPALPGRYILGEMSKRRLVMQKRLSKAISPPYVKTVKW